MLPIEQACFWMQTKRAPAQPPLQETKKVDIAIIGGGFTGLWTSVFLKQLAPSTEIALLEKECVGYGGSGRNAGILGETVDHSHHLAITHFGFEEARRLARIGKENVDEMAAFFSAHSLDCDFELSGRLYVSLTPAHVEDAKKSIEVATDLGVTGMRFLAKDEMYAEIHSPLYLGGVFASGAGILHPIKLIEGLKQFALKQGVQIFENTPVSKFHGVEVHTPHGSIHSQRVILATDAYSHHLFPQLLHRFIPLYDYILVSEPLTPEQQELIGWKNRQGVIDGRTFFNYYRLTADNRVVWGTSEAAYYSPNRVDQKYDHSEEHYASLRVSFARHFPQLSELKFPFGWGGPIASTTRLTPFFGTLDQGKIIYALGYTGHGIGSTRIAAKILANMALDRSCELLDLAMVRQKPFPYPPEPLRDVAVRAVTRSLRKVDQGKSPNLLLRILDRTGIGFSS
ncbi:MAG: hypothetical protein C5B54_11720 [Acidobacteria bacterium]|nr:MAG: hypothetical protein C5B54_11720 [Acidobacteriota bacterium]